MKKIPASNCVYRVELLEPRLLLAADWAAGLAPSWDVDGDLTGPIGDMNDYLTIGRETETGVTALSALPDSLDLNALLALDFTQDDGTQDTHAVTPDAMSDTAMRHEVVIIDAGVEVYEQLVADFEGRNGGETYYDIHVLAADANGVQSLTAILAGYTNLDALHIVSHGDNGGVQLGDTRLDSNSIDAYAQLLNGWSTALGESADLLIYGCDLAASDAGQNLIKQLGALTRADVAASDDATGLAELGGDWDFEYTLGEIDSALAFSTQLQSNWSGLLASFTVNTLNDTVDANPGDGLALDASGNTSLRAAIMEANALAGADTITLGAGNYLLGISGDDNTGAAGDLDVTDELSIVGAGSGVTTIDAQGIDRVLHAISDSLTVTDVTLTGGVAIGAFPDGGALFVETGASATLERVVVTGNSAQDGGGLFSNGSLTLRDATVTSNIAVQNGGGIRVSGITDLYAVTVSGNMAQSGAGFSISSGATATLTNVTVSGNDASANGGGLRVQGVVSLVNVTIADNTAGTAGGGVAINGGGASVAASNTIFADNTAATIGNDFDGSVISDGSNIIKDSAGSTGFGATEIADPLLDLVLRNNGGSTFTHALVAGSPAIDNINSIVTTPSDQRGYQRLGAVDSGAFEFGTLANGMPTALDDAYAAPADMTRSIDAIAGLLANDSDPELDPLLARILSGPVNGSLTPNPVALGGEFNLSVHLSADTRPEWSPDGSKVVFHSNRNGNLDIYVVNADGTGLTRLTTHAANDRYATWSPDGSQIAFRSDRALSDDIWVMDADGTNLVRLTTGAVADAAVDRDPHWAADGSLIVFVSDRGGDTDIFTMNPDGSNPVQLTNSSSVDQAPSISADGSRIAWVSNRDGNPEIYVMDVDGGNVERLTTFSGDDRAPSWSPDGSKILFDSVRDGDAEIFVMDADGTNLRQLTNNNAIDTQADWSADGSQIVFRSNSNSNFEIYTADILSDGAFSYTPNPGFTGADSFTYEATDGTAQSGPAMVTLTVDAVSGTGGVDTTVTSATDSTTENTDLVFSVANGNAITVADGTTNDPVLRTTLTVTNGVLNLASTAGLNSVVGDGTNTVIVIGAESAINASLDGLTFSPTASFTGAANLQITTDTQADLLGYYNFTQSNPLGLDASPAGGNDATPSGPGSLPDPNSVFDAVRNSDVLVLDGVDDNLLIAGRFGTPTNVTIAAWVNVATTNEQDVVSIGSSVGLRLNDVNNGLGVTGFFNDGTSWNHTDSAQFIGGDGWHHVAFTFDDTNSTQVIYINGVALGTTGYAASINWAHELNTTIGSHADGASYWLGGMMDDVRVYDRALSVSEIQAIAADQFSDTEVVSISVQPDNSAPVLTDDSPGLTAINEDEFTSGGDSVAAIVVDGSITDPDGAAVESIAITAVDDSNGTWQYSADNGATWNDVNDGSLGIDHALLLDGTLTGAATQRLRFVPNADYNGTATFTFRAWDMSGGAADTYADTTTNGGTSPYSVVTDAAEIIITAVNDAPLVDLNGSDAAGNNYATSFNEDDAPITVADIDATISDVDHTTYNSLTITLTNALNGTEERIRIGGQEFESTSPDTKVVTIGSTDFLISYDGTTFLVTRDGGGIIAESDMQSLIRSMTYENQDDDTLIGTRTFTFVLQDASGADSTASTTTINATATNDPPTFTTFASAVESTNEDTQVEISFADLTTQGNETDVDGTVDAFVVTSVTTGTLRIGTSDATATLWVAGTNDIIDIGTSAYWTPQANSNGVQNAFEVVARDDSGSVSASNVTAQVNVTAVNDAPGFSTLGDQNVLEDAGPQTVVGFAAALPGGGTDESGQTFIYTVNGDNPGLFVAGPAIDASGTLTYTLNPNINGTATVTVSVTDSGGTANGGVDTSADQTFDIIIGAVNDAPSFSTLGDQNVLEDSGPHSVIGFANALPGGGTDESGQTFTYTVNSDNPGLFVAGPAIDASGTLTYTLNPNINGTATVTVSVTDSGGTANGGVDTTVDQTFDIDVGAVNDAPIFSTLGDQFVLENSAGHSVASFASATPGGAADESGQNLSFVVISNNPSLFAVDPSIDDSGTLTYTLNPNVNGTARVAVYVTDSGGTANGGSDTSATQYFDIIVGNVGDQPVLLVSTSGNVGTSDAPGLDAWGHSTVLGFGDPGFALGPGIATSGVFTQAFELDAFGPDRNVNGLHYVSSSLTVGSGAAGTQFTLLPGDLLLSYQGGGGTYTGLTTSITVDEKDVFVFRPQAPGDYSNGEFYYLLDNPLTGGIQGIALVESSTVTVGDGPSLSQGTFLLSQVGGSLHDNIYTYQAQTIGNGTTTSLIGGQVLTDGQDSGDLGFSDRMHGIHLIEENTTIGGITFIAGDLLLSLDKDQLNPAGGVGTTNQEVRETDILRLRLSETQQGPNGRSIGEAVVVFEGTSVGLDSGNEDINGLTIIRAAPNVAPTATNLTQSWGFLEDAASVPLDDIVVSDANTSDTITVRLILADTAAGSLTTGSGNGETYNSGSGIWTVIGTLSQVNAALADVAFVPAFNSVASTTVTTHVEDQSGNGPSDGLITLNATAVNDAPSFSTLGDQNVLEDAGPQTVAGFASSLPGGGTDESGQTFTYNVSSDNPSLFLVGPAIDASGTLTYTLNSNINGTARVTVSVTDSGGTANGGVDTSADQTFDIIIGAVNDAPSFSTLGDQNVLEDAGPQTITGFASPLPGGGTDEAGQTFTYTVSSDNPSLFLVGPAIDASGTLTYTLNSNINGTARVTVSVTDSGGTANGGVDTSADQTFDLIIGAVNDAPSFSTLGDQNVLEDSGPHTVAGFASALPGGGTDEAGQTFTYNVSSDNPSLFLVGPAIDASGTLTYTLNANTNGTARVTVSVTDSGGTANGGVDTSADQTFDLIIGAVNDVPSFTTAGDQNVLEDSGPHTVAGFASPLPGGGTDEAGQTFTYNVSSDNPGLFLVGPAIDASGTLTYTLNTNTNGTARVTMSVTDSGGTANGGVDTSADQTFDLIIGAVNDVPSFSTLGDQNVLEDSGPHTVAGFASPLPGGGTDEAGQTFTYNVSSDNPSLFLVGPAIDASGTLTYTLNTNMNGSARVTVSVTDSGGTANGGVDTSADQSFDIIVGAVNDTPSFSTLGDQNVLEDAGPQTIAGFASSLPGGGTDESGQTFTYNVSSDNPSLFLVGPAIDASGTLTYTLNSNINGTARVTVSVTDSGGTANGGVDTSADQTFDINIVPVANVPTATNLNQSHTYLEDSGPVALTDIMVADSDVGDLITATLVLSDPGTGSLTAGSGNSESYASATGVWTVTGSVAQVNTALAAVAFVPATNNVASLTVSTHIEDLAGQGPADGLIALSVTPVNDAPSFTTLGDQSILEDAGPQTVIGFATALPGGGGDEAGQTFSYAISNDNSSLFLVGPAIDANGTLTYTLNPNANGTATVTASVTDSGGSTNGGADTSADQTFDIVISAVNDAPSLSLVGNQNVLEGTGPQTVALFASALPGGGTDEAVQTFTFTVSNNNPGLFLVDPAIDASGTLTYTVNPNFNGSATVTVSLSDSGGTANGGIENATDQNFEIVVAALDDTLTATNLTQTHLYLEDSGPVALNDILVNVGGAGGLISATLTLSNSATGHLSTGSGNGETYSATSGEWTIEGTVAQVNAALAAVAFVPVADNDVSTSIFTHVNNSAGQGPADGLVTLSVTPVNDAPTGDDRFISLLSNSVYTLNMADFGYSDAVEGHAAAGVEILSVPGSFAILTNLGTPVVAGQFISVDDIAAGHLRIVSVNSPDLTSFANLVFRVQDAGGTAAGGIDVDPSPNVLIFSINPIIDSSTAPVTLPNGELELSPGQPGTLNISEPQVDSTDALLNSLSDSSDSDAMVAEEPLTSSNTPTNPAPVSTEDASASASVLINDIHVQTFRGNTNFTDTTDDDSAAVHDLANNTIKQNASPPSPVINATADDIALSLDQMRNAVDEQRADGRMILNSSVASVLGLSVGYVSWLLRGGALLSSVLSAMPVWKFVDPLPVFARKRDDDSEEGTDESLAAIVRNRSKQIESLKNSTTSPAPADSSS